MEEAEEGKREGRRRRRPSVRGYRGSSVDDCNAARCPVLVTEWASTEYSVNLVIVSRVWVDFDLEVPQTCHTAQPILLSFHLPKLNWADRGMTKNKVNPTQVHDHQVHPVQ